jgi:hypothetical protein
MSEAKTQPSIAEAAQTAQTQAAAAAPALTPAPRLAIGSRVRSKQNKLTGKVIGFRHADGCPVVEADRPDASSPREASPYWVDAVPESNAEASAAGVVTASDAPEYKGAWLQTYLGRQLRVPEFNADAITLEETATVLTRLPRFGGRTLHPYVVSEHSVRVADCVALLGGTALEQFCAINHEGDESLLGFDPPSPLLRLLPDLQALKQAAHEAYQKRYGLPLTLPAVVKHADAILLATEKRDLMRTQPAAWPRMPEPLKNRIVPWSNPYARFVQRWRELARAAGYAGPE